MYVLQLEFDNEFLARRNTRKIEEIVRFIERSKARAVRIEATRGVALLSDGTEMVEVADIAKRRAKRVEKALIELDRRSMSQRLQRARLSPTAARRGCDAPIATPCASNAVTFQNSVSPWVNFAIVMTPRLRLV